MNEQPNRVDRDSGDHDTIARLVQLAGREPTLDALRRERLEVAIRPLWQQTVRRRRARSFGTRALVAAAAVLTVAVGTTSFLRVDPLGLRPVASIAQLVGALEVEGDELTTVGTALRPGRRLGTGEGRAALELRDGTSVRLDRQTKMRLLRGNELELEQGAVYIDTDGDSDSDTRAGSRLRVLTPFGAVEDIGTRFEVRVGPDSLRVRVRDGLIILRREASAWDTRPGEELTLGSDAQEPSRAAVPIWGAPWEWTLEVSSSEEFDGRRLSDFLAWATRESGTEVRYAGPELAEAAENTTVHGQVSGLPLHQALETVLPVCGLSYEIVAGELRLFAATARSGGAEGVAAASEDAR